jgi:Domain of unknown function (DUF397)
MIWRKSTFSEENDCVELAWRKSTFSDPTNCVESAWPTPSVVVRDSKNPTGPTLQFSRSAFTLFTT